MSARYTLLIRFLSICMLLAAVGGETAGAVIDFETTPLGVSPVDDASLPFAPAYNVAGVQLTFGFDLDSNGTVESNAVFEHAGLNPGEPPNAGFSGSSGTDTADPGFAAQLGNWFLRGPVSGANFGKFVIQYSSSTPVMAASGEIWDIDGNQQTGVTEEYTVEAFDSGSILLATIVSPLGMLDTPTAPLDGRPWVFAFSGLTAGIDHIVITFTGTKPMGIGLAFNNFNPIAAPEPASAALTCWGVLAARLRRRTRLKT